jgi:hypothetical protein
MTHPDAEFACFLFMLAAVAALILFIPVVVRRKAVGRSLATVAIIAFVGCVGATFFHHRRSTMAIDHHAALAAGHRHAQQQAKAELEAAMHRLELSLSRQWTGSFDRDVGKTLKAFRIAIPPAGALVVPWTPDDIDHFKAHADAAVALEKDKDEVCPAEDPDEHELVEEETVVASSAAENVVSDSISDAEDDKKEGWDPKIGTEHAPGQRPSWVDDPPHRTGDIHTVVVTSGPYESAALCEKYLDRDLIQAVQEYADWYLKAKGRQIVSWYGPARFQVSPNQIREYITDEFNDVHQSQTAGVGPMPVKYVRLDFDPAFREQMIDLHWQQSLTLDRMIKAGIAAIGLLGLLGSVYTFLKVDAVTGGQHRRVLALTIGLGVSVFVGLSLLIISYLLRL